MYLPGILLCWSAQSYSRVAREELLFLRLQGFNNFIIYYVIVVWRHPISEGRQNRARFGSNEHKSVPVLHSDVEALPLRVLQKASSTCDKL